MSRQRLGTRLETPAGQPCVCGKKEFTLDGDSAAYPRNLCCAQTYFDGVVVAVGGEWLEPPVGGPAVSALITGVPLQPHGASTALYRHLDTESTLLYIGISDRLRNRSSWHSRHSAWAPYVAQVTADWFASRKDAEAAERTSIKAERPLFNRAHSVPEARAALDLYLLKQAPTRAAGRQHSRSQK